MPAATKQNVTYVALKRLKVGDGYREPGDEVPEAASWPHLNAYLNTGHIAVVAGEGSAPIETRSEAGMKQAKQDTPRQPVRVKAPPRPQDVDEAVDEEGDDEAPDDTEELQAFYDDLNIPDVEQALTDEGYEDGDGVVLKLDPDQAERLEGNREAGWRKGVEEAIASRREELAAADEEEDEDSEEA